MKAFRFLVVSFLVTLAVPSLFYPVNSAYANSGKPKGSQRRCTTAAAAKGEYCVESENGFIKAFSCPADFYQCSGVNWKSEFQSSILFEVVDPEADPPHPYLQLNSGSVDSSKIIMNSAKEGVLSLSKKEISCGKDKGTQDWSLKKEGKYFHFKLNSTCGAESHSLEAICQKEERICTEATKSVVGQSIKSTPE